jgi:NTP pyrophosphatase (non-canonical NTP hydrolase)
MHVHEYQQWVEEYDRARGWDQIQPSQTLVHVMEELGEVAREVLTIEGYKPGEVEAARAHLSEELGDCLTLLLKLAYQYGIDAEAALAHNQAKCEGRYSVKEGKQDMARYLARQNENTARTRGEHERSV